MSKEDERFRREERKFDNPGERDPRKLLAIKSSIDKSLLDIATEVLEIRDLLNKAKPILPHGMLRSWVEETFEQPLPYPSVADYRAIYETPKGRPEIVRLLPVSYLSVALEENLHQEIDASIDELQQLKLDIEKRNPF
jgi:hypothetical protein